VPPVDGLDPVDRMILIALKDLQRESPGRSVPAITLWGVLVDRGVNLSQDALNARLTRLGARERVR
jgi:hypothetical protein